jgi:CRP-like cAMP-binding protein
MVDLASIRGARILEGLDASDFAALEPIAHHERVEQGRRLFVHGEEAERFYIVEEGEFALTVSLRALDDEVELAVEALGPGDAFGWSSLVEPHRSIYSAYCTAEGSVASFPRKSLEAVMAGDTGLGFRLAANLNRLIGSRVRVLQDLWIGEVEQSISRVSFWSGSDLSARWDAAVHPGRHHGGRRHLFWRRGQGAHPVGRS